VSGFPAPARALVLGGITWVIILVAVAWCGKRHPAWRETNLNDECGYPHENSGLVTSQQGQAVNYEGHEQPRRSANNPVMYRRPR
jgi:hypothetical protein